MRFNRQHRYNVPYGHKDDRFSKAYITKIVNQLEYVQRKIAENDWKFAAMRYEDAIAAAPDGSFIYCDPPYIGLTSTYYDSWDEEKETRLHDSLMDSGRKFMVSSWGSNDYRSNGLIGSLWADCHVASANHAYIVNGKHRPVVEVLLTNYTRSEGRSKHTDTDQLSPTPEPQRRLEGLFAVWGCPIGMSTRRDSYLGSCPGISISGMDTIGAPAAICRWHTIRGPACTDFGDFRLVSTAQVAAVDWRRQIDYA